jgi:hypothetical protein
LQCPVAKHLRALWDTMHKVKSILKLCTETFLINIMTYLTNRFPHKPQCFIQGWGCRWNSHTYMIVLLQCRFVLCTVFHRLVARPTIMKKPACKFLAKKFRARHYLVRSAFQPVPFSLRESYLKDKELTNTIHNPKGTLCMHIIIKHSLHLRTYVMQSKQTNP